MLMPSRIAKCLLFASFFLGISLRGQELNCNIQVLSPQIQGTTEKRIFENLQTSLYEFMNNTKWTKDVFTNDERIDCSIVITVNEKLSTDDFRGTIQVQSRRAVYKASYNSTLFNHNDLDFVFKYTEFQPLEFSESAFMSNLTSAMAYYAYIVIGLDYDSFSLNGGSPYYQKAQAIVSNAQNANDKGWKAFEGDRNRYWLVENLLNPTFSPLRECIYKYHRLGLDMMNKNKEVGRTEIAESLELLRKVHSAKPFSFNMQVFFNAKSDELVNIFTGDYGEQRAKVLNILNEVDPANSSKWQKVQNGPTD